MAQSSLGSLIHRSLEVRPLSRTFVLCFRRLFVLSPLIRDVEDCRVFGIPDLDFGSPPRFSAPSSQRVFFSLRSLQKRDPNIGAMTSLYRKPRKLRVKQ
jgi:hypothetical protein